MDCPACGSTQTKCIDSRQQISYRKRRYECLDCSKRFTTHEIVVEEQLTFRKSSQNLYIANGKSYVLGRFADD